MVFLVLKVKVKRKLYLMEMLLMKQLNPYHQKLRWSSKIHLNKCNLILEFEKHSMLQLSDLNITKDSTSWWKLEMYWSKILQPTYLKDAVKSVLRTTKGGHAIINIAQFSHFSTFSVLRKQETRTALDIQLV